MSSTDPLGVKIRTKIQWHRSEVQRLQAIIDEFDSDPQGTLPTVESSGRGASAASAKIFAPKPQSPFLEAFYAVMSEDAMANSREIADRLKEHGYKSDAADYYATIYNQLVWWAKKGIGVEKVGDRSTGVLFRRK